VALGELTLVVDEDEVAMLVEGMRIRIEKALINDENVARFMVPSAFGGQLELVAQIVSETITMMQTADQPTYSAMSQFNKGEADRAAGKYKEAYFHYRKAYFEATK
jgi:hypothetical protein